MPTAVRPRRIERTQPEEEEETAEGEESTEGKKKKDTKKKKDKKKKSGEEVTEERATYFTEGFYVDENGDEQYTSYYYYIDD